MEAKVCDIRTRHEYLTIRPSMPKYILQPVLAVSMQTIFSLTPHGMTQTPNPSTPERNSLLAQGSLASSVGMASILNLALHQLEFAGVRDVECGIVAPAFFARSTVSWGPWGPWGPARKQLVGLSG